MDQERQGASRATGLSPRPLSPPERSKGKHVPSTKTGGGHRPIDPGLSRGTDLGKLLAAVGEIKCLEERETETAQDGRRQLGKRTACLQGPKNQFGSEPRGQSRGPGTAVASRLDLQKGAAHRWQSSVTSRW